MGKVVMIDIIKLCLSLDTKAAVFYRKLSKIEKKRGLLDFWKSMASDETEHIGYWNQLLSLAEEGMIPQVFEKPHKVTDELKVISKKVDILLKQSESSLSIKDAFLLTYRLEFYMLHPAFETLFYFLKTVSGKKPPEDKYDLHIERFIKAINKYGTEAPELEILGETLRRLWYEGKQLTVQSFTDSLTNLLNRRGLTHSINILARLSERNKYTVGVMMIDIDHFKHVNDTYGHQQGDEVLKKVAGIIKGKIRASDIVGRYGGEEILVFLPEVKSEALTDTAEKIRSGVEKGTKEDIPVTISIGCTKGLIRGDVEKELAVLIKTADECMYKAKEAGRNKVVACN